MYRSSRWPIYWQAPIFGIFKLSALTDKFFCLADKCQKQLFILIAKRPFILTALRTTASEHSCECYLKSLISNYTVLYIQLYSYSCHIHSVLYVKLVLPGLHLGKYISKCTTKLNRLLGELLFTSFLFMFLTRSLFVKKNIRIPLHNPYRVIFQIYFLASSIIFFILINFAFNYF